MSGKEALNNLIEELKWCCNDGKKLRAYDKKMVEPIQRDLEILEIFKKHIYIDDYNVINISFDYSTQSAKEEDVIKEWLNNAI